MYDTTVLYSDADTRSRASLQLPRFAERKLELARGPQDHIVETLASFDVTLACGDEIVAHGCGANVLGSPMRAEAFGLDAFTLSL